MARDRRHPWLRLFFPDLRELNGICMHSIPDCILDQQRACLMAGAKSCMHAEYAWTSSFTVVTAVSLLDGLRYESKGHTEYVWGVGTFLFQPHESR